MENREETVICKDTGKMVDQPEACRRTREREAQQSIPLVTAGSGGRSARLGSVRAGGEDRGRHWEPWRGDGQVGSVAGGAIARRPGDRLLL